VGAFTPHQAKWLKDARWTFPDTVLADAVTQQRLDARRLRDPSHRAAAKPVERTVAER
jgi:hypothetical protein